MTAKDQILEQSSTDAVEALEPKKLVYDLHCHSNCSDGTLTPTELVKRAKEFGVDVLSLTDHDTIAGIPEAQAEAERQGIQLIPGVEVSVSSRWGLLHIVGLNVDPENEALKKSLHDQTSGRQDRTLKMAKKLESLGFYGACEAIVGMDSPGRLHLANFLLMKGHAETIAECFDKYLGEGKPAYVGHYWMYLEPAIKAIKEAGGVAVVAHPNRYNLSKAQIKEMLYEFKRLGGEGIEVSYAQCGDAVIAKFASLAKKVGLLASTGSDFHSPKQRWNQLGGAEPLRENLAKVWDSWELT